MWFAGSAGPVSRPIGPAAASATNCWAAGPRTTTWPPTPRRRKSARCSAIKRTLPLGAAFGVITVLGPRPAGMIEVATFRQDAEYSDGRHPDHVTFSSAREDAARRDFTINGMFFDPIDRQVIDFVGGQEDLQGRLIRAIGSPQLRFGEDKLRMLRAVRFAAAFGFRHRCGNGRRGPRDGRPDHGRQPRADRHGNAPLADRSRAGCKGSACWSSWAWPRPCCRRSCRRRNIAGPGRARRWTYWGGCSIPVSPWPWRPCWPSRPMPRRSARWASAGSYRTKRPTKRPGWSSIAMPWPGPARCPGRSCSPCSRIPGPSRW